MQGIKRFLRGEEHVSGLNLNAEDENGDAYLHVLVRRIIAPPSTKAKVKHKKAALECLWTFLVYCDSTHFDINIVSNKDGNTGLHIAVMVRLKLYYDCNYSLV